MSNELGLFLRRKRGKMSLREFAAKCNISHTHLDSIEKGADPRTGKPVSVSTETLRLIADGIGVDYLYLACLADGVDPSEVVNIRIPVTIPTVDLHLFSGETIPSSASALDFSHFTAIPIMGRIAAGLPLYAEQNIEGYTMTDLNGGAEYFALRVYGDSMNALGINDGYVIIVRRQETVDNGEVAVVMVGDEDATVKRFYSSNTTVTLMPQSTNPVHAPQIYDISTTPIKVLGKVVKVEFTL